MLARRGGGRWQWLIGLRPRRWATAAGLAPPPYLAGLAIDRGINTGDLSTLDWIVAAHTCCRRSSTRGATYAQTYLVGWVGQRALQDLRERIYPAPPGDI